MVRIKFNSSWFCNVSIFSSSAIVFVTVHDVFSPLFFVVH